MTKKKKVDETSEENKLDKNEEKILPFIIDSAKQLEKGGADFIVIPCNTVHVFIDEIRNSVKIPVLSRLGKRKFLLNN